MTAVSVHRVCTVMAQNTNKQPFETFIFNTFLCVFTIQLKKEQNRTVVMSLTVVLLSMVVLAGQPM